jgi:hypothetical protein
MDLAMQRTEALRMGQDLLVELAWKRMLTQEGMPMAKGPYGSVQADWLAQNLAHELSGQMGSRTEVGHGA